MEGISVTLLSLLFFWEGNLRQIAKECRWTKKRSGHWWESKPSCEADRPINLTTDHTEVVEKSPLYRPLHIPLQILSPNSSVLRYFQSSSHSLKRNSVMMSASCRGCLTHVRVQCSLWKNGRSLERHPHHPQYLGRGHTILTSRELE
jgi:hypothetical protein